MKTFHASVWVSVMTAAAISCQAQILSTQAFSFSVNQPVPDGNLTGLAVSTNLNFGDMFSLSNVAVTLNISGTWNGDLYAYLTHGSGYSILLNRTGRSLLDSLGYSDDGFQITLNDQAAGALDIHTYRMSLGVPVGPVTGTWLSDGRNVDPATVLDTSPRAATLNSFSGLNPNGDWTLFLSDLAGGNESVLVSWGITAVGAVPEPGSAFMMLAALPAIWWVARRKQRH